MSYKNITKCAEGVSTPDLKKILGVHSRANFNREILKISSVLNSFGLVLRCVESKWYLMYHTENPPSDLSKSVMITLAIIYETNLKNTNITAESIKERRGLTLNTIRNHLKELQEKNYIKIDDKKLIEITTKTKESIKLKRFD